MVIWITGISASGKTTLGRHLLKFYKKKNYDFIFFDGDELRYCISSDLGYTLKDRNTNATRITRLVKYLSDQKKNVIVSGNLTSQSYRDWCKKNIKNYFEIYIESNFETLVKRDSKGIYSKKTPVVGKSIKFSRPKFSNFYITNTGSLLAIASINTLGKPSP